MVAARRLTNCLIIQINSGYPVHAVNGICWLDGHLDPGWDQAAPDGVPY